MGKRLKGALLVGGTTALFSTFGLASRSIALNGWQIAFLLGIGGVVAGLFVAPRDSFEQKAMWPYILVAGILYLDNALILGAYEHTTFARAILLHYLGPIWVALYELFPSGRTSFNILKRGYTLALAALSFVAVAMMVQPTELVLTYGDAIALASSLTLAGLIVGQNRLSRTASPGDLMYVLAKWSAVFGAPAALYYSWPISEVEFGAGTVGLGLLYGLIFRGAGTYAYNAGTRYLSGTAASFLGLMEIVGTTLIGWVAYGEWPVLMTVGGGVLIVFVNVMMIYPPSFMMQSTEVEDSAGRCSSPQS